MVTIVERPHVVSIVDALRFLQRQQYTDSTKRLMEEQLEVSDVLVVNKLDLISVEDRDALVCTMLKDKLIATILTKSLKSTI